ncbi:serine hydrolase domain-containing protein [Sphingomicrobium arenosum]|uniref:serine hydrolase domain-containing protein n=1 Tax=Sphingomicrobium arenosum TaxID=2233861 RepID=UPI0022410205|nr:serine hydrolase domain-containing protein [Sphingomicrobium arenosum]
MRPLARLPLLLLFLVGLVASPAHAHDLAADLDAIAQRHFEEARLPGLAVAVVNDGRLVYQGTFGDARPGVPLTPAHAFHVASLSKPFVATAIMLLVEEGQLGLDDPVVRHLPYFPFDPAITVRQMLSHSSGLPDVTDYGWDRPDYDDAAAERYVRSLERGTALFVPGEDRVYSNMAFDVLGDLIAKVSVVPFEQYVETRLLRPVGMLTSSFFYPDIPFANRVFGHEGEERRRVAHHPYNRPHAPSSTLNASLGDMVQWMQFNLQRGVVGTREILGKDSFEGLWSAQSADGRNGLSWFRYADGDRWSVYHGGADTGFRARISLYPDEGMGIVILSNWDGFDYGPLYFELLGALAD